MVKSCCVPFCQSRKAKDCKLLFHSFPVSTDLRERWLQAVQQHTRKSPRKNSNLFVIKNQTKVCSRHFLQTDYWHAGNVLKLRKSAVPTIFTLPKGNDSIPASCTSGEENKQTRDFVSKEEELTSHDHTKKIKQAAAKIPRKAIELVNKKQKNDKAVKNLKDPEMIQNCKNLLRITKDHAYAALWQNESVESKRDNSSEDDTDIDEHEMPSSADVTEGIANAILQAQQQLPATVVEEIIVEEIEKIALNKTDTEICSTAKSQNNANIANAEVNEAIESIYLKEEVIEEVFEDVDGTTIYESNNDEQDASHNNNIVSCSQPIENQNISTVVTNTQTSNIENDNVAHTKPHKRVNASSKKSLPEICILCATANMTRKNYTFIVHFSEVIKDLSGVDILKSNVAPTACNVCFKNVLEMWNFKQQIIAADKFIREKIPKQTPSLANTGNVPKPAEASFEYIDCNKHNLNGTIINSRSYRQHDNVDNLDQKASVQKTNKLLSIVKNKANATLVPPKSKSDLQKKDNGITLVPIEDILKDNTAVDDDDYDDIDSESSEDCSNLPTCTVCGNAFPDNGSKTCKCKEHMKKEDAQTEKFVCSICGKQYPLLRSLKRHEVTHKTKKYLCNVCGEVFHFQLYLKRHMRKHSGKKPFACPYCNKKFSSQWNLCQHKRIHTNSSPYECRLCPTAFRHNVTLKKHVRLFHTADEFMQNCQSSTSSASLDGKKN